jgi:hypothetical protein
LGHNIHVPIHGLCNLLFLYSQSNQAECCHLVMLFSASTKLWKASSRLFICLSVCPSIHLSAYNNSASSGQIFMKFDIWVFFESLSRKSKLHWNLTRIMSTLREDHYTLLIISRSNLPRMRNVSDKSCRENHNTLFFVNNFFF